MAESLSRASVYAQPGGRPGTGRRSVVPGRYGLLRIAGLAMATWYVVYYI